MLHKGVIPNTLTSSLSQQLNQEFNKSLLDRGRFVRAPADDLSMMDDESVDAITTRSVLVYVADLKRHFTLIHRSCRQGMFSDTRLPA